MNLPTKQFVTVGVAAASLFALPVGAERYVDFAQVVGATPVYQRVNQPRQECWNETVTTNDVRGSPDVPVGAIVGGIAGGVLGHQIGSGRGRDVATVAGAVGGAVVGNQIDQNNRTTTVTPTTRDVQRCRTVDNFTEVIQGYDVRYVYGGREFVTRMPYDPGDRLRVRVNIAVDDR